MTEQELRQQLIKAAYEWSISSGDESIPDVVMPICKAYADAQVEASVGRQQPIFEAAMNAKNTEIAELKAESKYWNERWEAGNKLQDAAFNSEIENYHEVKRLNAEIKRLRDGIKKGFEKLAEIPYCSVLRTIFDNAKGVQNDLESLLSPAPVTAVDQNGLPTDDEIHFVAVDESNAERHGWQSLNQKPAYVDGFEDGAKWMRNKKTT